MEKKIIPICGLPRSGSTLLCNILAQNPKFHTTPTSGCHDVLFSIKNNWGKLIEHRASPDLSHEDNERRVLSSVLHSYHNTDKPVVFDKGRGWTSMLEMLEWILGHETKVLVPVRNITQILSSFEKLYRENIKKSQIEGDYFQQQTVQGRCLSLLRNDAVLGLAYDRLKDCIQRGFRNRLFFVEFDKLTNDPEKTMNEIYSFLGESYFKHDFNNVEQITYEEDKVHGMDLHTIRSKVSPVEDDSVSVLGQSVVDQYSNTEFWRD